MKVLIVLSLTLALIGCVWCDSAGRFEKKEQGEDRSEIIHEERLKDNEILEAAHKDSDKLHTKTGSGEAVSADIEQLYENIFEFKDFEDIAHKNDLSKNKKFALQIVDESDHDESNAFQSSRGTSLNTKVKESNDLDLDTEKFDKEEVKAESDSASKKAHGREFAEENLFGDRSETLFGRGIRFEFENLDDDHHDDHHDSGIFSGSPFFHNGLRGSVFDRFRIRTGLKHH